ncbi:MAG TPA: hypothetical protein VIW22_06315 [Nitrososphaerales archaeon]
MNSSIIAGLTIVVLAVALVLGGFGAGAVFLGKNSAGVTTTITKTTANSSSPYVVTLVISTLNIFNSTVGEMPSFYVLGPGGLESAAKISLPVNRTIELVIVNYDQGNGTLVQPNVNAVSGTTDGSVLVASNSNINSSQGASGIVIKGGQRVSSVPLAQVSHTFTVPNLNLNIPVPLGSTVVATFTIHKAGSFLWFCLIACGDPAMAAPGWMRGSVSVS